MKNVRLYVHPCLFFLLVTSCGGQTTPTTNPPETIAAPKNGEQIGEYVVEIYEDKKGDLWFGTIGKGVARYDGKKLTYLSIKDGLMDDVVTSVVEDKEGNFWIGTHSGLSRYDGRTFTNFTTKEGLCNDRVSGLLIDQAGTLWVATWNGVCVYKGSFFTDFPLPKPDVDTPLNPDTKGWVTEMMEDRQGNLWFGRDGYGACKYDGKTFTLFTKKDGLASNGVQAIVQDNQGNLWFGSRVAENDHPDPEKRTGAGGLTRYDGKTFTHFPEWKGLNKNNVYTIYQDRTGNLWIGATGVGLYRYDGKTFKMYTGTDRMDLTWSYGIQAMLEDRNGTLWLGFSGGLFRLVGEEVRNVGVEEFRE